MYDINEHSLNFNKMWVVIKIMTLNEAIQHAKEKYLEQLRDAEIVKSCHGEFAPGYHKHCECAAEHKQLMEWLEELQERRNRDL